MREGKLDTLYMQIYSVSHKRRPYFKIEKYFWSTSDDKEDKINEIWLKIFKQAGVFFGRPCTIEGQN